jgi:murein DD-endopeptidase MepM/ murein hydrolase activator NlpD
MRQRADRSDPRCGATSASPRRTDASRSSGRSLLALVVAALALGAAACPRPRPRRIPVYKFDEGVRAIRGTWHTVAEGETLAAIAARYDALAEDVVEINDLRGAPRAGDTVFVPARAGGADAWGTTPGVPAAAVTGGTGVAASAPASTASAADLGRAALAALGCLSWPLDAPVVTSGFGVRGGKAHDGLDIAGPEGTLVHAAADGEVLYAGDELAGYGNLVVLRHAPGLSTVYAHNRKNLVAAGEHVARGAVIAEVGHTGRATGPHVHFEVRVGETPRNPRPFLPPACGDGDGALPPS